MLTACLLTLCVYLVIFPFFPSFHLVKLFRLCLIYLLCLPSSIGE